MPSLKLNNRYHAKHSKIVSFVLNWPCIDDGRYHPELHILSLSWCIELGPVWARTMGEVYTTLHRH